MTYFKELEKLVLKSVEPPSSSSKLVWTRGLSQDISSEFTHIQGSEGKMEYQLSREDIGYYIGVNLLGDDDSDDDEPPITKLTPVGPVLAG